MRIYLACPYYHSNLSIREYRFKQSCRAAAALIKQKLVVFSPIAHSHSINEVGGLHEDASYGLWMMQDLPLVKWADEFWILDLSGWEDSKGVGIERRYARKLGKPIGLLDPVTYQIFYLTTSQTKE